MEYSIHYSTVYVYGFGAKANSYDSNICLAYEFILVNGIDEFLPKLFHIFTGLSHI